MDFMILIAVVAIIFFSFNTSKSSRASGFNAAFILPAALLAVFGIGSIFDTSASKVLALIGFIIISIFVWAALFKNLKTQNQTMTKMNSCL